MVAKGVAEAAAASKVRKRVMLQKRIPEIEQIFWFSLEDRQHVGFKLMMINSLMRD